ncbi:MAG: hypothetical protein H0X25_09010 [Acidobacteriales bacterium]|nr:hypothetical protein [Terriglobales bacterium]
MEKRFYDEALPRSIRVEITRMNTPRGTDLHSGDGEFCGAVRRIKCAYLTEDQSSPDDGKTTSSRLHIF